MKYIRLVDNTAAEIIPEENPELPGFPISDRYPAKFIAALIPVENSVDVEEHYTYDPVAGIFTAPVIPEPIEPEADDETEAIT